MYTHKKVSFGFNFSEAYGCKPVHDKPDNVLYRITYYCMVVSWWSSRCLSNVCVFFYIYYIDLARAINASLSKQSALSENGAN